MKKLFLILFALLLMLSSGPAGAANLVQQPSIGWMPVTLSGADANGINDSAAAFNAFGAANPVVYVGPGTYKLASNVTSGTIWVIGPNVTFTGAGTLTGGVVLILAQMQPPNNITIAGGNVLCTGATAPYAQTACTAAPLRTLLDGVYQAIGAGASVNQYDLLATATPSTVYQNQTLNNRVILRLCRRTPRV